MNTIRTPKPKPERKKTPNKKNSEHKPKVFKSMHDYMQEYTPSLLKKQDESSPDFSNLGLKNT